MPLDKLGVCSAVHHAMSVVSCVLGTGAWQLLHFTMQAISAWRSTSLHAATLHKRAMDPAWGKQQYHSCCMRQRAGTVKLLSQPSAAAHG